MRSIVIAGTLLALGVGMPVHAGDAPVVAKVPPPLDVTVKVEAPDGTSEQDIAAAIAGENAKRDPAAREAAQVTKRKADQDEAHNERVSKICESIPDKAMRSDPSLRKMCE